MATTVLSSTFNAFAFAGAGWIFSKINHGDYQAEMKRHNRAIEQLTRERDRWNQARLRELDRVSSLRYAKDQAKKDLDSTNEDLLDYADYADATAKIQHVNTTFEKTKPQLKNYYKPSDQMQGYMNLVKFATTIPAVYTALTFL